MHFNDKWFFALEAFSISVTLLMTFVIEHTQRVDTKALHEKIDELIKKNPQADNEKIGVEKRYKGEK